MPLRALMGTTLWEHFKLSSSTYKCGHNIVLTNATLIKKENNSLRCKCFKGILLTILPNRKTPEKHYIISLTFITVVKEFKICFYKCHPNLKKWHNSLHRKYFEGILLTI